jgi:hypothetical protein
VNGSTERISFNGIEMLLSPSLASVFIYGKVKLSLYQVVKVHRVVSHRGSHIF